MLFLLALIALGLDCPNFAFLLGLGQVAYSIDLLKESLTKGK